jgi:tetratricopeptide (TPR) repeat protein
LISSASATSRIAAERRRRARATAGLTLCALLLAPPAGGSEAAAADFELGRSVQHSLARIQEGWLQWVGATLQDNRVRADEALRAVSGAVREVGFAHLPDLALAALAQARQAAAAGNFERARRQLEAAERLDPGRPEVAFAEAAVARAQGAWLRVPTAALRGFARLWSGLEGRIAATSLMLWLLSVLVAGGGLFVALLAFRRGPHALTRLHTAMAPPLSPWVAGVLLTFLLIAPAALPSGLFCLLAVWSLALWGVANRSERGVLLLVWLVAASAPLVSDRAQRALALEKSPPMRAWDAFERARLHGSFFADLQVLRSALADRPAALELAADVHRTLGQWDLARTLYRRVVFEEPENVPVLLNLGAFHFRRGDFALANAYFERATRTPTPSAAAWYNLSLGYSDAYLFDASRQALERAREIDAAAVDRWISLANPDRVLTFNGSLGRRQEVRRSLLSVWGARDPDRRRDAWQRWLPAAGVLIAAIVALLSGGFRSRRAGKHGEHGETVRIVRWARRLLPPLDAADRGEGLLAWAHLVLLLALASLPRAFDFAGDLPVVGWRGPRTLAAVTLAGLVLYLAVRLRPAHERSEE